MSRSVLKIENNKKVYHFPQNASVLAHILFNVTTASFIMQDKNFLIFPSSI